MSSFVGLFGLVESFEPETAVHISVLDSFVYVIGTNIGAAFQIGNGAGYPQNAVESASREV